MTTQATTSHSKILEHPGLDIHMEVVFYNEERERRLLNNLNMSSMLGEINVVEDDTVPLNTAFITSSLGTYNIDSGILDPKKFSVIKDTSA